MKQETKHRLIVLFFAVLLLLTVLFWLRQYVVRELEEYPGEGIPNESQYEMIVYSNLDLTVEQNRFPLYYEDVTEESKIGSVSILYNSVRFAIGEADLPLDDEDDGNMPEGTGNVADRFLGYRQSLQQLYDAGYTDYFVICYKNGVYLLGGYKDGEIGVLPMWERRRGMEYLFSHFLHPATLEYAEEAMSRWVALYIMDKEVMNDPDLYPNMAFEDPPKENWSYSPVKNTRNSFHDCDDDPRNQ